MKIPFADVRGFGLNAQGFLPELPVYCREFHDLCMKKSDINGWASTLINVVALDFYVFGEFFDFFSSNT